MIRAPEFEAAGAVIVGASFDTVEEQRAFADAEGFPYALISDTDKAVGRSYDAERGPGEDYYDWGVPRRITYLIDPEGRIAVGLRPRGPGPCQPRGAGPSRHRPILTGLTRPARPFCSRFPGHMASFREQKPWGPVRRVTPV